MAVSVAVTISPVAQAGAANDTTATKRIEQDMFEEFTQWVQRHGKSITACTWSGGTITAAAYTSGSGQLTDSGGQPS